MQPSRPLLLLAALALTGSGSALLGQTTAASATAPRRTTPETPDKPIPTEAVELSEFRVETNQDNSYLATETTSGTRMSQKIIDLPYSVQSLPSEFFNDFMLFDIDEMNGFVSNVKPADSAGAGNGGARLRGFSMPNFRNGFAITQQPDSNNVDRVEILKGPSAGIYGATSPGGVMNFITKKPKSRPEYELEYIIGDYDYNRVNASATGPITKNLLYRIDGTYYDFKRPTDFWYNRTMDISGGLTWKPWANTTINAEFAFTERAANPFVVFTRWVDSTNRTQGLVYTIPEDRYPGYAERLSRFNQSGPYNRYERYNNSSYLNFQHRFNPNWSAQANLSYTNRHFRRFGATSLGNWSFVTNNWTGNRTPYHQRFNYEQIGVQADVVGKIGSERVPQEMHFGFDYIYLGQKMKTWNLTNTALILAGLAPGTVLSQWQKPNPFDPDYLVRSGHVDFNSQTWPMVDGSTNNLYTADTGLFYNHVIHFFDHRFIVMATVRGDRYEQKRQQPLTTRTTLREATSEEDYFNYSTGASLKLWSEKVVMYGSYGSSFDPSPSVDQNTGDIYGNTEAKGGELGFKGILLNQKFSYSAAAFSVVQENETVNNPDNPGATNPLLPALAPGGSSKSTGIGIDVSGRLTDNIQLIGNMGWLESRTIKNLATPANVGQRVANSGPARKGSIGATYSFRDGWLKGLRAGFTYYYSTENVRIYGTATSSTVYLPPNGYWGGFIAYSFRPTRKMQASIHLAGTDLFDQQILTDNAFWPQGPTGKLSLKLKF